MTFKICHLVLTSFNWNSLLSHSWPTFQKALLVLPKTKIIYFLLMIFTKKGCVLEIIRSNPKLNHIPKSICQVHIPKFTTYKSSAERQVPYSTHLHQHNTTRVNYLTYIKVYQKSTVNINRGLKHVGVLIFLASPAIKTTLDTWHHPDDCGTSKSRFQNSFLGTRCGFNWAPSHMECKSQGPMPWLSHEEKGSSTRV